MTNKGMSVLHCQDAFKIYMLYWKPLDDNASVPPEPVEGGREAVTYPSSNFGWIGSKAYLFPQMIWPSIIACPQIFRPSALSLNFMNETMIGEVLFVSYRKEELKTNYRISPYSFLSWIVSEAKIQFIR